MEINIKNNLKQYDIDLHFTEDECSLVKNNYCLLEDFNRLSKIKIPDFSAIRDKIGYEGRGFEMYCPSLAEYLLSNVHQGVFSKIDIDKLFGRYTVGDGRHRLCIAKKLNIPIYGIEKDIYLEIEKNCYNSKTNIKCSVCGEEISMNYRDIKFGWNICPHCNKPLVLVILPKETLGI